MLFSLHVCPTSFCSSVVTIFKSSFVIALLYTDQNTYQNIICAKHSIVHYGWLQNQVKTQLQLWKYDTDKYDCDNFVWLKISEIIKESKFS